jgi:hypothetical protein
MEQSEEDKMQDNRVTLESLQRGAMNELFLYHLEKVLENVMDINTDLKKKRQINLKVSIWPRDEKREIVNCEIVCDSRLAPENPIVSSLSIGHERIEGELRAVAYEMSYPTLDQLSKTTADDYTLEVKNGF